MPQFSSSDLALWSGGQWAGGEPPPASGVSIDTRTLRPGDTYLALRGDHFDGHDFVASAFEKGAVSAIVSKDLPAPRPALRVADTRRALRDIARGHRARLKTSFVAVTGSVGKTTVKELTADVLAMAGPTARTMGNFNNDIGLPLSLLAVEPGDRNGVFELGMSHPGELAPLCELLRPTAGIITTIGPVHLESFSSLEGIAREKASVLKALPPDGVAVLSRDEPWFDLLRSLTPCPVITTSLGRDADYIAERSGPGHFTVREARTGQQTHFTSPLPGEYFVRDALLAIALGRHRGLAWASIAEAIKNYRPIRLRWQTSRWFGVDVINDAYNANPVSMRAALDAFAELDASGRKWLVLGGMLELGAAERAEHEELGRWIARGGWAGLIAVGRLGAVLAEAARAAGASAEIVACADRAAAGAALAERIRPRDAVLFKGSRGERVEDVLNEWIKQKEKEGALHE